MKISGFVLALIAVISLFAIMILGGIPMTPGQWTEWLEDMTQGEFWGMIFIDIAFISAVIALVVTFFTGRLGGYLCFVSMILMIIGTVIGSTFIEVNSLYMYVDAIAFFIAGYLIVISVLKKKDAGVYAIALAFLFLPMLILAVFTFYPLIKGVILSFAQYNMFTGKTKWVGLQNYRDVFHDRYFFSALKNTFQYLIVVIPIQFFAIVLSVLVNQKIPGIRFFRTLFYIPVITGAVVVSLCWKWIYAEDGLINYFLLNLHIIKEPVLWLTDKAVVLWSAMFVTFWRGLGYYMVIYLAGLQNIPADVYEAAALDGATGVKKFFRITLPLMRPSILLCTVLSTMSAFQVFEEIFLLTGGAAGSSTLAYEIYDRAFVRYNFGNSAAMAIVLSLIISVFTVINFRFFGAGRDLKKERTAK